VSSSHNNKGEKKKEKNCWSVRKGPRKRKQTKKRKKKRRSAFEDKSRGVCEWLGGDGTRPACPGEKKKVKAERGLARSSVSRKRGKKKKKGRASIYLLEKTEKGEGGK